MARLLLAITAAIFLQIALAQRCPTATYKITVKSLFTAENVPGAPPDPHFSQLTVVSHSTRFSALVRYGYATEGIRNLAELGDNTLLLEELSSESAMPFINAVAAADDITDGGEEVTVVIQVNCNMPVITAVAMVAPSPDWFIAAANINMYNGKFFIESLDGVLPAYDAGTDSGTTFLAPDEPTIPRQNIAPLGAPFTMPAATFRIERMRSGCRRVKYELTVRNMWTTRRFPDAPIGNLLSPLTAFSHGRRFSAFTLFGFASPGVQEVAETGNNALFLEELASESAAPFIMDVSTSEGPATMGRNFSTTIELDCMHTYVSFLSMLAPSPDWIVAEASLNTMVDGTFRRRISGSLFAYDAGTDSGTTPTSPDMPTVPQQNIAMLQGPPFNGQPVARYSLVRMEV